jgi:hypothetical protein
MIYMSPESWEFVRPHVERLLELESELVLEEGPEKDKPRKDRPRKDRPRKDRPRKDRPRKDRH